MRLGDIMLQELLKTIQYRTFDEGETFERLNTNRQMFGEINSIDGDCRVFGRFYLATGSIGILYGEPVKQ